MPQSTVFLPQMALTLVRRVTARLPYNHYLFRADPKHTKHEVREYLEKVYNVKVARITTSISLGEDEIEIYQPTNSQSQLPTQRTALQPFLDHPNAIYLCMITCMTASEMRSRSYRLSDRHISFPASSSRRTPTHPSYIPRLLHHLQERPGESQASACSASSRTTSVFLCGLQTTRHSSLHHQPRQQQQQQPRRRRLELSCGDRIY
jgi:hypothetical protein